MTERVRYTKAMLKMHEHVLRNEVQKQKLRSLAKGGGNPPSPRGNERSAQPNPKNLGLDNITFLLLIMCMFVIFLGNGTIFSDPVYKISTVGTLVVTLVLRNMEYWGYRSPIDTKRLNLLTAAQIITVLLVGSFSMTQVMEN
jgi:hypothetical protein